MNIMENKRVTAIAAVMGVLFAGLCYKGYESYNTLQSVRAEIERKNSQVQGFASEKLQPTQKNNKLLIEASNEVEKCAVELARDVEKYAAFCIRGESQGALAYRPNASPVDFQNRLRALSAKINEDLGDHCVLNNAVGDFGMTNLKNQAPTEIAAPYYNFLLSAVNGAVHHIIDAGAPSVERVYCAPLPEEELTARRPAVYFSIDPKVASGAGLVFNKEDARKDLKLAYFPLSFEIAFTAKRSEVIDPEKPDTFSVIPQVLNKLSQDQKIFYVVTGVAVSTLQNPPTVSGSTAQAAPADDAAASAEQARKASLILGGADDRVNVHLSIQAYYFTTAKS